MKLRAVLFDATGVLIELARPAGETYAAVAGRHGGALPAWRLEDAFRRVLRHAPPRVSPGSDHAAASAAERAWWREVVRQTFQAADSTLPFDDFDAMFADLYATFAFAEPWRLRPGAASALAALRRAGLATGVVSNFDHRLDGILEDLGIASLLDVTMIPSRCGAAKPDPAIFRAALALIGVVPGDAAYVGHAPETDAAGACAAGLVPVLLREEEALTALPARLERIATLGA